MVRERFPDHDIRWAFTSGFIVMKLNEAGIATVFDNNTPLKGLDVKFGYPLLFSPEHIQNGAAVLSSEFRGEDTATILVGHGNEEHPEFHAALIQMGNHLRNNYDNVFLGTVEGPPGPDQALADAKASGLPQVKFVPLMMVEGDHITNDISKNTTVG